MAFERWETMPPIDKERRFARIRNMGWDEILREVNLRCTK